MPFASAMSSVLANRNQTPSNCEVYTNGMRSAFEKGLNALEVFFIDDISRDSQSSLGIRAELLDWITLAGLATPRKHK